MRIICMGIVIYRDNYIPAVQSVSFRYVSVPVQNFSVYVMFIEETNFSPVKRHGQIHVAFQSLICQCLFF